MYVKFYFIFSDSSESEESDSDEESPEVNESFRANVKAALGHAAVASDVEVCISFTSVAGRAKSR